MDLGMRGCRADKVETTVGTRHQKQEELGAVTIEWEEVFATLNCNN